MISSIFFILWRLAELFFLIPMVGMLSYIIRGFQQANMLTPDFVLVIFIVTVLAAVWTLATLLFFASAKRSGWFLPLVDLAFFGAFIGTFPADFRHGHPKTEADPETSHRLRCRPSRYRRSLMQRFRRQPSRPDGATASAFCQ